MDPEMIPTPESSNVEEIGYDSAAEEVWVRFRSGGTYVYVGVPPATWEDFRNAPSKGSFVHHTIKNFPYRKI